MDTPVAVTPIALPAPRPATLPVTLRRWSAAAQGRRIAQATRQLIALGHRRILLVAHVEADALRADAELQGHGEVMLAAGLPLLPRLELDTASKLDWPEWQSALEAVAPTALLCTRAALVPPLEAALRSHGLLSQLIVGGTDNGVATAGATHH
ncbi:MULTISPECIES: substrate-binding domain-containing protein [Pseudomonas]|uniref:substrate-binding domain-containing protein n=1 Tax=Pseudomonas TaxID=286 RepID=UPI00036D3464|nr:MULTISPECIES: substrate-binding domain-containing protein [Pseudomonas]MDC7827859.1 substrate-binding domain-containing protein [Pseudomonas benzopyrenica]